MQDDNRNPFEELTDPRGLGSKVDGILSVPVPESTYLSANLAASVDAPGKSEAPEISVVAREPEQAQTMQEGSKEEISSSVSDTIAGMRVSLNEARAELASVTSGNANEVVASASQLNQSSEALGGAGDVAPVEASQLEASQNLENSESLLEEGVSADEAPSIVVPSKSVKEVEREQKEEQVSAVLDTAADRVRQVGGSTASIATVDSVMNTNSVTPMDRDGIERSRSNPQDGAQLSAVTEAVTPQTNPATPPVDMHTAEQARIEAEKQKQRDEERAQQTREAMGAALGILVTVAMGGKQFNLDLPARFTDLKRSSIDPELSSLPDKQLSSPMQTPINSVVLAQKQQMQPAGGAVLAA